MSTVTNAFIGRIGSAPTAEELAAVLGETAQTAWNELLAYLESPEIGVTGAEWKCYSAKSGWAMRVYKSGQGPARPKIDSGSIARVPPKGARTIVWLAPCLDESFQAAIVLGPKAVLAASELSAAIRRLLEESPKYPEGTGVRINVKKSKDLAAIKKLAWIKVRN